MAQSEDVELRDLVIDALDKNGSLPKIRALLRANIFLAFEEECENIKQNPILDSILQTQEGLLALSLVHEFLEFCNLRNTMFVYVSESRQGKEYKYEGRKRLAEKFANVKRDFDKEPILISIMKTIIASHTLNIDNVKKKSLFLKNGMKVDENCTYIVHEDSSSISSQSNSHSDKSSDEKNKSMLRLSLDNSDTDTSSDSTRDKTSSEYIANENIIVDGDSDDSKKSINLSQHKQDTIPKTDLKQKNNDTLRICAHSETVLLNPYTSSDSTSYLDLHTFKNTRTFSSTKGSLKNLFESSSKQVFNKQSNISSNKTKPLFLNSKSSVKQAGMLNENKYFNKGADDIVKPDTITSDYSNDFTSSPVSLQDSTALRNDDINGNSGIAINNSPRHELSSSQSSVSISDVADLIDFDSSNSPIKLQKSNSDDNISCNSVKDKLIDIKNKIKRTLNDDSDESIVSSIPSLSNLSLDCHSEERL